MRRSVVPRTALIVLTTVLTILVAGSAWGQTDSPGKGSGLYVDEWHRVMRAATARIEIFDPDGAPLRQTYGTTIGDPPRIVTRLTPFLGAGRAVLTFPDGTEISTDSALAFDPVNDIAILKTGGVLPRPPNPDETIQWRYREPVHVIPGPGMEDVWPEEHTTTPFEKGKLRIVPISGDYPGGLPVMHDCGRWIGLTGRIEDATGTFTYITPLESVAAALFGTEQPTPLGEAAAAAGGHLDAARPEGLLVRAVLRSFRDPDEATPFFNLALELDPAVPELQFWYGKNLFRQQKYVAAEAAFREAFRLRPDWGEAYQMAGASANQLGNYDVALRLYDEGLKINPKNTNLMINRWGALYNLGRIQEAVAVLLEVVEIDPTSELARYNLGTTYHRMGKIAEAEEQYQKLMEMKSSYAEKLRARLDGG